MKSVPLGPFAGINNRLPDHQLKVVEQSRGRKSGDFLRNAINVDLTNAGTLKRRPGSTLSLEGEDVHSLWGDGDDAFYIDGTELFRVTEAMGKQTVRSALTPRQHASFARYVNDVYWSNSAIIERIQDGVSAAIGVPVPNPEPVVGAGTGGGLPAGAYQVAITAMSAAGEESGATWPVQVIVEEGGSVEITGIEASGFATNVYFTALNGDVLFLEAMLPPGTTDYTISVASPLGRQITTLGLRPMPPGHIVRQFNGRLLVAASNVLFISEPYAPALYNPARGYIPFPDRISIMEPCEGGVYVASDQTYWLAGSDPSDAKLDPVLPYGAVEHSGGRNDSAKEVWWFSHRGVCVGDVNGRAKNIQEDNVVVEQAVSGAAFYREQDGLRQIVSSLFGAKASIAAANSFMEAEVIRKESML